MSENMVIKNARLHNLKNISLSIPKNKLVVLTGLSGSGKSTLAFDILFKEGQRQFLESLGFVSFGLSKPRVDSIEGLSPSISVDQTFGNHSPRSTLGTVTDVFTYLRILFARLGHRPCPHCGADVPPSQDVNSTELWDDEAPAGMGFLEDEETYPCPVCGRPVPEISMGHFSFNKPAGACPTCTGLGVVLMPNLAQIIDEKRSIQGGAVLIWNEAWKKYCLEILKAAGKTYGFVFDPDQPVAQFSQEIRDLLLYGVDSPQMKRNFPTIEPPTTNARGHFEGIVPTILRRHAEHVDDPNYLEKMEKLIRQEVCPECQGTRLRAESRKVSVAGRNIIELGQMPLTELAAWLEALPVSLLPDEKIISEPILADLNTRLRHLLDVGVGYLSMDRDSPTLSAGETQRLRLASLLGSGLTGVLYVLDEPTIGLHPRDTGRLIRVLRQLRDLGNTVLVIEHDLEMMRSADYIIDIGPGAGRNGGRVVVAGPLETVKANPESITGGYLSGRLLTSPAQPRPLNDKQLVIYGARAHNLKNITARIPLGLLVAISGPSGSGKSSLLFDIVDRAGRQRFYGASELPGGHDSISGWEYLDRIITIDQIAIGRTARSNAATYTDAFTPIREAFAASPAAVKAGFSPRHFSFNVPGGRCERCEGAGVLSVEMHFLPDVSVRCPVCHGRRFKRDVLAVKYGPGRGFDISEVLDMTIDEALPLIRDIPGAAARLGLMVDVGLGYLQLGQPANSLSGGEAQRVKLAKELGRRSNGRTLFLLDEPTTGLHPADTAHLLLVLQRLVDAGNSVVIIEHNLDVIRVADWIIDLGPEGGESGGQIMAEGRPAEVARISASPTGKYLL